MAYLYIVLTILFTVYGQMVIKWQVVCAGPLPGEMLEKVKFLMLLILNPWVFTGFVAAFMASMAWMAAMTKFPLSHAYPFMSIAFVLVLTLSGWLFQEAITLPKVLGMILIVAGIVLSSQG